MRIKSDIPGVLGEIVRAKLGALPEDGADPAGTPRDFFGALARSGLGLIAEIRQVVLDLSGDLIQDSERELARVMIAQ